MDENQFIVSGDLICKTRKSGGCYIMSLSDENAILISSDELEPLAITLLSIAGIDAAPDRVTVPIAGDVEWDSGAMSWRKKWSATGWKPVTP